MKKLERWSTFSAVPTGGQVQEAVAASEGFLRMPDAPINMGNLFLALGKPKLAIQVLYAALYNFHCLHRREHVPERIAWEHACMMPEKSCKY